MNIHFLVIPNSEICYQIEIMSKIYLLEPNPYPVNHKQLKSLGALEYCNGVKKSHLQKNNPDTLACAP